MWQYFEVVRFAFGLSDQPSALAEIIFEKLPKVKNFWQFNVLILTFLEGELKEGSKFDVFHNRYFNHVTLNCPVVAIPSEFYRFDDVTPERNNVIFRLDQLALADVSPAECLLDITKKDSLLNALRILRDIQKHQQVYVSWLDLSGVSSETEPFQNDEKTEMIKLLTSALKFNQRTSLISIDGGQLPQETCSHIVSKLQGCTKLEDLHLINFKQGVPLQLGDFVAVMISLKAINLTDCGLDPDVSKKLMSGLRHCLQLQNLSLQGNNLANCLVMFLGQGPAAFPSLHTLGLGSAELKNEDITAIGSAVEQGKLPALKLLDLSGNILTGCINNLVPTERGNHPGYVQLEILNLIQTGLNSTDVGNLSRASHLKKLPTLKTLRLGFNTLTGGITKLFEPKDHPRFTSLRQLDLSYSGLNKTDLKHMSMVLTNRSYSNCKILHLHGVKLMGITGNLFADVGLPFINVLNLQDTKIGRTDVISISHAIRCGKLPQLRKLLLFYNNFRSAEDVIKILIKTCSECYRKMGIDIGISLNDFWDPDNFAKEIEHLLQNTKVSIIWNQITESHGRSLDIQFGVMSLVQTFPVGPGVNIVQVPPPDYLLRYFVHPPPPHAYRRAATAHKGN